MAHRQDLFMLILYVITGCPFCQVVLDYINENNLQVDIRNIDNRENFNQLLKSGGQIQAPFLIDEENKKSMYESKDIIEYLKSLS